MNEDIMQGYWKQLSGKLKQKWAKLTDDDLKQAQGDRDYLLGKLQEYYGLARDKAETALKDLGYKAGERGLGDRTDRAGSTGRGQGSAHRNG